jgi:hypothetical protein
MSPWGYQGAVVPHRTRGFERPQLNGGLNRSMQHFILEYLRGGVDHEIQNSDLLH